MNVLFFKARIPGAGAADLFSTTIQVGGYTTPEGHYVAPHAAIRHKRTLLASTPSKPALDLFAHADAAAAKPAPVRRAKPAAPAAPDLFSVVAPPLVESTPAPVAATAPPPIPPSVMEWIKGALEELATVRDSMAHARTNLDAVHGGKGRYETDALHNQREAVAKAQAVLVKIRGFAEAKGIDFDAVLAGMGGVPDVSPSPEVAAYSAGMAGQAAPSPDSTVALGAADPAPIEVFGVSAGVKEKERRTLNAAALDLLGAKADADMTDADRATLARYSGTGGCGDSRNEFYTSPDVAAAMWGLLARAGFKGGDVLEPSCGTGVFLHTAPGGARVTGVEMDPVGGRIAGILHGPAGHEVNVSTLERFATTDGRLFDAVIGNCPFGIRGGSLRDDKRHLASGEAYFLDTGLDKLRDGGLMAMVVPTGVMDGSNNRALREALLSKAEFLGASRLPNTAFEASNTSVTSDVLLYRKRPQDVAGALGTVPDTVLHQLGVNDEELVNGHYFTAGRGAANIHGTLEPGWRAKAGLGSDITVSGSMVGVASALQAMPIETPPASPTLAAVLDALGDDDGAKLRANSAAARPPYQVAKLGDVKTEDGIRYVLQGDPPRWHRADADLHPAVTEAVRLGEVMEALLEGRGKDAALARAGLVEDLDAFVAKHGLPAQSKVLRQWFAAPSMPNNEETGENGHALRVANAHRAAAKVLGMVNDDGTYSDLVTGQARKVDAADVDTMALKLSLDAGGFTPDQLAAATGGSVDSVLDHLHASAGYALDPDGRTWTTLDAYLSGEMWPKYDAARMAAARPGAVPADAARWARQAAALDAAIAPQSLEDVEINLASGFLTPEDLNGWFIAKREAVLADRPYMANSMGRVTQFAYDGAAWTVEGGGATAQLILRFLNRTGVRKVDREKLGRLNDSFADWLRGSDRREEVENRYNRTHRGFRAPRFSDAPIAIPGLAPPFEVNNYHWSGLRWALKAGSGIVADDVGLGKTPRGLMLAKLAQATGEAKKPIIVVPKSVLANWVQSAEEWFPGSKVLVIGETYSRDKKGNLVSKADDADTRRKKLHALQQNTYDFVLISMPAWNQLDVSPELKEGYIADDFWTRRGEALQGAKDSKVARAKAADEQRLAAKEFVSREDTLYFDQLGVDMVILDEAHAYKNLYSARNRFGESPKFLGGSGESGRAQDTYYKTRALRGATGGKGVFALTATPTKNSPLEIYSMLAQIAPEAFERMGITNSEAFLDRFCEFTPDEILTVDGQMKEELVVSGFKNLDELREVMRRYIDRRTAADVGLVIPKGVPTDHYVDMTDEQEAEYQGLRAQYAEVAKGGGDGTGESHIFSIMSRMGKASLDLGLLNPAYAGARSPKVDKCLDVAVANAADGGQIIFCDHVDMHEKLADALVARGIPREQIGIFNAQAADTGAKRQKICDEFNKGLKKFVIGNTPVMGEGVNLQKGTADIHHLDLPWEPASMHQRNGRGVRQGNKKGSVRLHSYLAKASFDGYRYQTMMAKRDWQDMLWNGADKVENLAREGKFSRHDTLIMMSADPEAARAKHDGDKAAAQERKRAEERGQANEAFQRHNKMGRALAKLRAQPDPEKAQPLAILRLEQKRHVLREQLQDMRGFTHHDLLDSAEPVLIEGNTNHAWLKGRGIVMATGDTAPIRSAPHEESRWVVTAVDPDKRTVTAREYGGRKYYERSPVTMELDRMKEGVTPFEVVGAEEDAYRNQAEEKAKAETEARYSRRWNR